MSSSAARPVRPLTCSRRDLVRIGWLVAAYVAIRAVGVLILHAGVHAGRGEQRPGATLDELGSWDGDWYARIAVDGYPDELSLVSVRDDTSGALVFPPLYPMLMRVLHLAGLTADAAGLLITSIAGIAAVVGVYAVARDLVGTRASMTAALLWSAGPMTVVLSMVYSEALFVALAAWAIWLARRGWWLTAGLLALLSGLTRSTGLATGAAVAVAALLAWRTASSRWRPVTGAVLAVIGVPLWWLYVAIVGGRLDGWFAIQEFFWGSRFDYGRSVLVNAWQVVTFGADYPSVARVVYGLSAAAMVSAVLLLGFLLAAALRRNVGRSARAWWPVAAYAVVLVVLAAGSAGFTASKIRFLVPMFPLLLLPARRLAELGRPARFAIVGGAVVASGWIGSFMLTVWPYAI